jgi:hypothetical protein
MHLAIVASSVTLATRTTSDHAFAFIDERRAALIVAAGEIKKLNFVKGTLKPGVCVGTNCATLHTCDAR